MLQFDKSLNNNNKKKIQRCRSASSLSSCLKIRIWTKNRENWHKFSKISSSNIHSFFEPKWQCLLDGPSKTQNWHLSVVLLCFFVVSSHADDGLLQSNASSQFSVGNGAHVREKAAPAHGAPSGGSILCSGAAFLLSFQLKISHQLPMRLPVFSTDL